MLKILPPEPFAEPSITKTLEAHVFFQRFTKNLPGEPSFRSFWHDDINPLSGTRKRRLIRAPNDSMRIVHERLIRFLREELRVRTHSANLRDSPVDNLNRHINWSSSRGRYFPLHFYCLDLKNAYGSVSVEQMVEVICDEGSRFVFSSDQCREFLITFCMDPAGGLITGAPASPDLFNLYMEVVVDRELRRLCKVHGLSYSRYLDDLLFSAVKVPIGKKKRRNIRSVVESASLVVNHRKSRVLSLRHGPAFINGVGIRRDGKVFLPRRRLRRLRGMLHSALMGLDVDPNQIAGEYGLFISHTDVATANKTEQNILGLYERYRLGRGYGSDRRGFPDFVL